jgi:hypothetical protein
VVWSHKKAWAFAGGHLNPAIRPAVKAIFAMLSPSIAYIGQDVTMDVSKFPENRPISINTHGLKNLVTY